MRWELRIWTGYDSGVSLAACLDYIEEIQQLIVRVLYIMLAMK